MPQPQHSGASDTLNALLALLALSGDSPEARKALAAARFAGPMALRTMAPNAKVGGIPASAAAGYAASAAGLGLTLADIAKANISTREKIGYGTQAAGDIGMSFIPVAGQYYALARLAKGLSGQLERSSSPQVRGAGRAIGQTAEPRGAGILRTTMRGQNPWTGHHGNPYGASESFVLDLLGPLGAALQGAGVGDKVARNIMDFGPFPGAGWGMKKLGLVHEPTEGTQFRRSMEQVLKRIPGFETFEGGTSRNYDMTPEQLAALDKRDVEAASQLARIIAPHGAKYREEYTDQLRNMLLNLYGHPGELVQKLPGALNFLMTPQ